MADDQSSKDPKSSSGGEADAADLLSLWGAAPKAKTPPPPPPPLQPGGQISATPESTQPVPPHPAPSASPSSLSSTPKVESKPSPSQPLQPNPKPILPPPQPSTPSKPTEPAPKPLPPPPRPAPSPMPPKPTQPPPAPPKPKPEAPPKFESPPPTAKPFKSPEPEPVPPWEAPKPTPTPTPAREPENPRVPKVVETEGPPANIIEPTLRSPQATPEPKKEKKAADKAEKKVEPEIITGEVVGSETEPAPAKKSPVSEPDESEGFRHQLQEFLAELNISRSQIVTAVIGFFLIITLGFGGYYGYRWFTNRPATPGSPQTSPPPPQPPTGETGIDAATHIGSRSSVDPNFSGDTGIVAALRFGTDEIAPTGLSRYLLVFRQLQNAYATDLNDLLNKATDRRARLHSYLAVLRALYDQGQGFVTELGQQIAALKTEHDTKLAAQRVADNNFFEQLNAFNGPTAGDILQEFIKLSRDVVELRARYKALQQVQGFYVRGLPKVAARIRDIELNQEALISGIKVYDVGGSDLQLVVPVDGAAGSSAGGPVNTSPSLTTSDESSGVADFISSPSGGPNIIIKPNSGTGFVTAPGGGNNPK